MKENRGETAGRFLTLLEEAGFDLFAGVPCSALKGLFALLEDHPRLLYIPAVREDVAVGLATGASLAGRRSVVLMQNSGLGTSLNAFTSLNLIYKIPLLVLVSWRGFQGRDAPEHLIMGGSVTQVLDAVGMPYLTLEPDRLERAVEWAKTVMEEKGVPATLLIQPGIFE